jgi:hypothetical protein
VKISFEKLWAIFFSFHVDALLRRSLLKTSLHNQQMLLQNEGISVLRNMPIGLFRKRNDVLGNLSVSLHSKSRNGGRVAWDHRRGEH